MKICNGLSTRVPVQQQPQKKEGRSRFHRLQSDPCDRRWGLLEPVVTAFMDVTGGKSGPCFKGDACQVTWYKDSASGVPAAPQGQEFLAGSVCQPSPRCLQASLKVHCLALQPPGNLEGPVLVHGSPSSCRCSQGTSPTGGGGEGGWLKASVDGELESQLAFGQLALFVTCSCSES